MGTCYDYTIKWFYDASISRCRRFYYGSCGGNGNRFETREDCVMTCVERRAKPMVEVVVEKGSRLLCMSLAWLLIHELTTRWHGCMFTNSEHDCLSGCSFVWFVRNYLFSISECLRSCRVYQSRQLISCLIIIRFIPCHSRIFTTPPHFTKNNNYDEKNSFENKF